jgi:nucleoside 2-deoxyribosyltransferase-like protein
MRTIEAPHQFDGRGPSLFLAGGVTGCADWQARLVDMLPGLDVTALNPRRRHFDVADDSATVEQIEWEFRHLRRASAIAFWFPAESICPIALFELGAWSERGTPLLVGADARYVRRRDVVEQLRLARAGTPIAATLDDLAASIDAHFRAR